MEFIVRPSTLRGEVDIPGSKSHTIRGVLLASLADGESVLEAPLASADTEAAVGVYQQLGARFELGSDEWRIHGVGSSMRQPEAPLDVRNSGTTLNVAMGTCALLPGDGVTLTGDAQIQRRPSRALAAALNDLGAQVVAERDNGCAPFRVRGVLRGGHTSIECRSSQYLTSLLLACPLATGDSEIEVPLLMEKPYVSMTLDWLDFMGVKLERDGLERFSVPGGQRYQPFRRRIPADFSTATFFLVAGALGENRVTSCGLDLQDSQSDKAVVEFLRAMGADIQVAGDAITVSPKTLQGTEFDMNDCPDALPMMAVLGCFAEGETRLVNVEQARIKETDRIAVMCAELRKLGADITERPDGLVIRRSQLRGGAVDGHHDHRVVMSLAVAGTQIPGETRISTAEAASVTVPQFAALMTQLGADLSSQD